MGIFTRFRLSIFHLSRFIFNINVIQESISTKWHLIHNLGFKYESFVYTDQAGIKEFAFEICKALLNKIRVNRSYRKCQIEPLWLFSSKSISFLNFPDLWGNLLVVERNEELVTLFIFIYPIHCLSITPNRRFL